MKSFIKILAIGAVVAASSSVAFATPITGSIAISMKNNGDVDFTSTSIAFDPTSGRVSGANGTLAGFAGDSATLSDFTYADADGVVLFKADKNNVSYTLLDATAVMGPNGNSITITGDGTFAETGYASTPGTFILTASNSGVANFEITGTATSVTPEPNSLVLMGTGLIGAAGMLFMRRRAADQMI